MKTQLLVTVKDAGFYTKSCSSLLWFIDIFKKYQINVYFDNTDSTPVTLTARPEPYELPLSPGTHVVYFEDPKAEWRLRTQKLVKNLYLGLFGFVIGGFAGGLDGAFIGSSVSTDTKPIEVRENVLYCTLADGDEMAVTVKPRFKKVQVKVEN